MPEYTLTEIKTDLEAHCLDRMGMHGDAQSAIRNTIQLLQNELDNPGSYKVDSITQLYAEQISRHAFMVGLNSNGVRALRHVLHWLKGEQVEEQEPPEGGKVVEDQSAGVPVQAGQTAEEVGPADDDAADE